MPRRTIRLTPDEDRALEREAKARGLTFTALVRERLGLAPPRKRGAPTGNQNAARKPRP